MNIRASGCVDFNFSAKYKNKDTTQAVLVDEATLETKFSIVRKGDIVGYSHLNYYDPIDYWVEFPNHGVKLLIGQ